MNESYDTYIETINGLEVVEAQVIKHSKIKRCCYLSLKFVEAVNICLKNVKNLNNINERYNRK